MPETPTAVRPAQDACEIRLETTSGETWVIVEDTEVRDEHGRRIRLHDLASVIRDEDAEWIVLGVSFRKSLRRKAEPWEDPERVPSVERMHPTRVSVRVSTIAEVAELFPPAEGEA